MGYSYIYLNKESEYFFVHHSFIIGISTIIPFYRIKFILIIFLVDFLSLCKKRLYTVFYFMTVTRSVNISVISSFFKSRMRMDKWSWHPHWSSSPQLNITTRASPALSPTRWQKGAAPSRLQRLRDSASCVRHSVFVCINMNHTEVDRNFCWSRSIGYFNNVETEPWYQTLFK